MMRAISANPLPFCTGCGIIADKKVKGLVKTRWLPYCTHCSNILLNILKVLGIAYMVEVTSL